VDIITSTNKANTEALNATRPIDQAGGFAIHSHLISDQAEDLYASFIGFAFFYQMANLALRLVGLTIATKIR